MFVDHSVDDHDERKRRRTEDIKAVLRQWEPDDLAHMAEAGMQLQIKQNIVAELPSLRSTTTNVVDEVRAEIKKWKKDISDLDFRAMVIIALRAKADFHWDHRSDLVVVRILGALTLDVLRGHSDKVVTYRNGAWVAVAEIPAPMLVSIDKIIWRASQIFENLAEHKISRTWNILFDYLKTALPDLVTGKNQDDHWARGASKQLFNMGPRFGSGGGKAKALVELYGNWFLIDHPDKEPLINFEDAQLKIISEGPPYLEQVDKSPSSDCYVHIPCSINYEVSDEKKLLMRMFLTTTFAGNPELRRIELAVESLCFNNVPIPQKLLILRGPGGDGKSLRSHLRQNVFGLLHKYMTPNVFTIDEEFRKQGGQFANALAVTFQECNGGVALLEEVFKKFVSGEMMACRPNYGSTTSYYSWDSAAKFWEMNLLTPVIKGDPNDVARLRSWTRRLLVLSFQSTYVADSGAVDIGNRIFCDDPTLKTYLVSPEARHIYVKYHLLPFLEQTTKEECMALLLQPAPEISDETISFLQQMANGGLEPFKPTTAPVGAG